MNKSVRPRENTSTEECHLFILSGQSNMEGLDPEASFKPELEKYFGRDIILVVKDAEDGQPIRRWHKTWNGIECRNPALNKGDLYDRLLEKIRRTTNQVELTTVSFLWMQGECDAREGHGEVYLDSLRGLYQQLSTDLNRNDIRLILGRLSRHGLGDPTWPHWGLVREAQVQFASERPLFDWVDTDDLNGSQNDLHYTQEGYRVFGERLAKKAIELLA